MHQISPYRTTYTNPFSNKIQNEPIFVSITMHKDNKIIAEEDLDNFIYIVKSKPKLKFMTLIPINYVSLKEKSTSEDFESQNNSDHVLDLPKKLFENLNVTRICILDKMIHLYCQHGITTYTNIILKDRKIDIDVIKNKFKIPLNVSKGILF